MNLKGKFKIAALDEDGIEIREVSNLIVNTGKAQVAGLVLKDIGGTAFDYLAVGTGTTAPNAAQTALVGEKYREAGTGSRITTTVANDTARITSNFAITVSATMSEIGVLNSSSNGIMLSRATFSGIGVESGNTLSARYDCVMS